MKHAHNIILNTDSYKYSQWCQYPPGTEYIYSYIESRGSKEYDELVFIGLQAFLREYLSVPITQEMIDFAEKIVIKHGEPFNRSGWEYILRNHNGYLPVQIKAVDEGTVIKLKNVLLSIVNTDPECYWLTSFVETALLRAIWYPTSVASNSYKSKKIISDALERTGTPSLIDFKLNDFGARGVSSYESSALGGLGHLAIFMGTDNMPGVLAAMEYYDSDISGFSIPAMEHSTVTSWGKENETEAFRNMLKQYGKPGALIACVSDSYDIYEACKKWGTELKDEVINSGAVVVIRPDSGNPSDVVVRCLYILEKYFGSTTNSKNYRVLNNVRIIQGDGIDHKSIHSILFCMEIAGFSADNIAFGQGGGLLQMVNRDTFEFAMKCSAARINDEWVEVYKDPITSSLKKSKKGRLDLVIDKNGEFVTMKLEDAQADYESKLIQRFRNGKLYNQTTFEQIRELVNKPVR